MIKVGSLMRLISGYDWHNGYVIDNKDNIIASMYFTKSDTALFLSERKSLYNSGDIRYRCLVGGRLVLFKSGCLEAIKHD